MMSDTMTSQVAADPYWSRSANTWERADRHDPIVWGEAAGPMASNDLQEYERQGFRHFSSLFSPDEAGALLDEANRLAGEVDRARPGVVYEPASKVVRSLFRIHRTNAMFRAVAKDPRIVNMVRQLLDSDVYIHQSRINFKPALDGKEFFWHSDFETWHIEDGMPRMRAVSVSLSLTDNNEFNGPLMVIPGSHKSFVRCAGGTPDNHFEQSLKKQEYGVPSREALRQLAEEGEITAPKGPPGSALMFDCNLMHGSVGNLSPYPRTNLFLVYNSIENRLEGPFADKPARPDFLGERDIVPVGEL